MNRSIGACALMMCLTAHGAERDFPVAWLEPVPTASDLRIDAFEQSPVLDGLELPAVARRLPHDPPVLTPFAAAGEFGGTARIVSADAGMLNPPEGLVTIAADHKTILPNLAEWWEYNADGRRLTVRLRDGLKWSDGAPLTTADFVFMTNDLQLNPDYQPVTPRNLAGLQLRAADPLTLEFEFPRPNPLFINYLAQLPDLFIAPKHYFEQFHPSYTDPIQLAARLRDLGYINWSTFIQANLQSRIEEAVERPTMRAFKPASISQRVVLYERNPYYFKVDPQGRQLPYIDAIEAQTISSDATAISMAATGQVDFSGFLMATRDIPLLKLGERSHDIEVKVWRRLHGSDLAIQPNFNHTDQKLRELFWDVRFRRALSIAIDRQEMNQIIYYGLGVPRQVTVIPSSDYFDAEFASAHTEFDPAASNLLLDELGLRDIDGDGLREYPDGSKLVITVEYVDTETPKQISMELVATYWRAVGIDLRLKLIDRGLQYARAIAGKMEMTVWHADRTTDILFPIRPDFWVPRVLAASLCMWNDWTRWYLTDGQQGSQPPPQIRELQAWADQLGTTMDPDVRVELGRKILAVNAAQIWSIGTIGLAPHPVVVSSRLKNVPAEGLWGFDTRWTLPYHPATWYLED